VRLENSAANAVGTRRFQRHIAAAAQRFAALGQTVTAADAMPYPNPG
jgi:hypothetical protein